MRATRKQTIVWRRLMAVTAALVVTAGCTAEAPSPGGAMSPKARIYLTKALDIMQRNSLLSAEVDWTAVRREAFDQARTAQTHRCPRPAPVTSAPGGSVMTSRRSGGLMSTNGRNSAIIPPRAPTALEMCRYRGFGPKRGRPTPGPGTSRTHRVLEVFRRSLSAGTTD